MRNVFSTCFAWFRRYHHPYRDVHILVIGIDNAGKSTTVASIQNDSTDGITPTIGFASSSLRMRRCDVTMLDVGGGSKIRGIWENYYAEVHGIVFVIDASDAQRIGEARDVLEEVVKDARMGGKPVLLLANKNDVDGAMDEIDVCNQLNVHELMEQQQFSCQVEQCVAVKRKCDRAIMRGMKWLLQIVCDNYNALAERVNADVAVQREEEARERRERAERVRILREER
ncbi:ADP-ribosylation factor-like protein 13B [Corticium candelabrum]|uniref:ADP-ribosylation factor-like protein 13B n=1 Tax=Corticium candelabrum TaxID=121492 RepID=UPI002E25AA34|nr:ADP-ribosylation factor-like protein 13B [Corticium candelabrum]